MTGRHRARWRNIAAIACLLLAAVGGWEWAAATSHDIIHSLRISWDGESVRMASSDDGPFVVTHLVAEDYRISGNGKETAALQPPIAIVDSDGYILEKDAYQHLDWIGVHGEKLPPPPVGSHLTALYFEPLEARPRVTSPSR